jgi:cell division protein FtsL
MKRIKNFNQFCNEKFIPQPDDSEVTASDKNFANEEEQLISNFNSYKVDLENIYKSYFDEKDLQNKLFNKGFLLQKTADPKKIKFKNKYLSKWARICGLKRKLEDLDKIIKGNLSDLENYKKTVSDNKGNETVIDDTQNKIENTNSRIDKNSLKFKEIEQEVYDLDRELKNEFELLKKKHKETKKRLEKEEMYKKSSPVDSEEDGKSSLEDKEQP